MYYIKCQSRKKEEEEKSASYNSSSFYSSGPGFFGGEWFNASMECRVYLSPCESIYIWPLIASYFSFFLSSCPPPPEFLFWTTWKLLLTVNNDDPFPLLDYTVRSTRFPTITQPPPTRENKQTHTQKKKKKYPNGFCFVCFNFFS